MYLVFKVVSFWRDSSVVGETPVRYWVVNWVVSTCERSCEPWYGDEAVRLICGAPAVVGVLLGAVELEQLEWNVAFWCCSSVRCCCWGPCWQWLFNRSSSRVLNSVRVACGVRWCWTAVWSRMTIQSCA